MFEAKKSKRKGKAALQEKKKNQRESRAEHQKQRHGDVSIAAFFAHIDAMRFGRIFFRVVAGVM